jgi:hypothetical protein
MPWGCKYVIHLDVVWRIFVETSFDLLHIDTSPSDRRWKGPLTDRLWAQRVLLVCFADVEARVLQIPIHQWGSQLWSMRMLSVLGTHR